MREMATNHYLLMLKNTALGGYSLIQHDKGWTEGARVWAEPVGNGVGKKLLEDMTTRVPGRLLSITASPEVAKLYTGNATDGKPFGFESFDLMQAQTDSSLDLPTYVQSYRITDGKPRFLLLRGNYRL